MSAFAIALLVVVVFVAGQLLLLRPNPRERRLMALRMAARRLGLMPRLLPPPDWYRGPRPAGGLLACYSLVLSEEEKGLPYFRAERSADGHWDVRAGQATLLVGLAFPPEAATLLALETRANSVSLWWREDRDDASLPALAALLRDLLSRLR